MRLHRWWTQIGPSLVSSPDPPIKAERGSGVLSNISYHMWQGLSHKECHNFTWHHGLEQLRLLHVMVYNGSRRPWSILGQPRTSCGQVYCTSNSQFNYNRLHHACIITRSAIWFKLSDQRATLPNVTRKVTQNTKASFSHMQEGLDMRIGPVLQLSLTVLLAKEFPQTGVSTMTTY